MGFKNGLKAAAALLVATAEDYEEMAGRLRSQNNRSSRTGADLLEQKAQLLRGQAQHILNLKE